MTYNYLSDQLLQYNKLTQDCLRIAGSDVEYAQPQVRYILGELVELTEVLTYILTDSKDNFNYVTQFLEEHCPNSFSIMIANLDSNPDKYETLFDLCAEIDIKKEDNFEFPIKCLKKIQIYVD